MVLPVKWLRRIGNAVGWAGYVLARAVDKLTASSEAAGSSARSPSSD